jgi:hypothetical protein
MYTMQAATAIALTIAGTSAAAAPRLSWHFPFGKRLHLSCDKVTENGGRAGEHDWGNLGEQGELLDQATVTRETAIILFLNA